MCDTVPVFDNDGNVIGSATIGADHVAKIELDQDVVVQERRDISFSYVAELGRDINEDAPVIKWISIT